MACDIKLAEITASTSQPPYAVSPELLTPSLGAASPIIRRRPRYFISNTAIREDRSYADSDPDAQASEFRLFISTVDETRLAVTVFCWTFQLAAEIRVGC